MKLIAGGNVVRTTTGRDAENLCWNSWNVSDLIGQTAKVEAIDTSPSSWGRINVDQITLGDLLSA